MFVSDRETAEFGAAYPKDDGLRFRVPGTLRRATSLVGLRLFTVTGSPP